MCPLSAASQAIVLLFLVLICGMSLVQSLELFLQPKEFTLHMYEKATVNYSVQGDLDPGEMYCLQIKSDDPHIVEADKNIYIAYNNSSGSFDVVGNFLGRTNVTATIQPKCINSTVSSLDTTTIKVLRKKRVIDTVFITVIALFVSIIYINFGCTLKWSDLKSYIKRPIGPVIGFVGQFVLMPLLSYVIGYSIFPDNPEMQLGIFFTGCAPAGGASNIWTALLDGNIDLSITMTTISTFAAFAMIPFWTFTLGSEIFNRSNLKVPYGKIASSAIGLFIPLLIGFLLQKYSEKAANFFRRTLKMFSGILIIFIIIFATVTNLYLFELFSWQIIISGMGLPWLGYVGGWLLATVLKQSPKDSLTIAIEVGLQNTGIAIFLLQFSLPQPEADLTTIAPVSVAIMTPIPLFILFLIRLILKRKRNQNEKKLNNVLANSDVESDETKLKHIES